MDSKHEKIAGNNQDVFFHLHPKVSDYCNLKVSNLNGKNILVVLNNFFMFSIQDNWYVLEIMLYEKSIWLFWGENVINIYVSLLILDGLAKLVLHKAVTTALCFQVLAMNH